MIINKFLIVEKYPRFLLLPRGSGAHHLRAHITVYNNKWYIHDWACIVMKLRHFISECNHMLRRETHIGAEHQHISCLTIFISYQTRIHRACRV